MADSAPTRLGRYEVVSSIGKGGMGEVFKGRDPQLNRDVALKVSAQQFTDRFEREARAIAALNHTNICTLYDIGPNYLVMEFVEGPTLAERIAEGPIPLEEALGIAKQIAAALEVAHEKPIVHRDLKPANIKIKPDGSVKVLDFGLAKLGEYAEVTSDSPTMMSIPGMILGTAGYMSPEQARGKDVDKRADIWAFGVVLYEMLTGKRLFEGETVSDTLAAVIREEPDLTKVPVKVQRLLRRCLEKDPKKRLRDITGMEFLLEGTSGTGSPAQTGGLPQCARHGQSLVG
jgi:serine/threonine-protein kinase